MNNYLANIAARSFNLTPTVRPRLPAQFEPAPVQPEGAISRPEFNRPPLMAIELQESERLAPLETSPRRASDRRPTKSFGVKDEPGYAPPSSREYRIKPQSVRIEAPPIQPSSNRLTETGRLDGLSPARRDRAESQPDAGGAPRAALVSSPSSERHRVSSAAEQTTGTIQPALAKRDEEPHNPRPPVARLLSATATVEPQLVGVREKPALGDFAQHDDNGPKTSPLTPIAPSSRVSEVSDSPDRLPVIVQSRVAPRLEGDRLAFNQQAKASPEPTVHVTIGRIEVRAVQSSQASSAKPRATPPVMNLDDYLRRRRNGGER